MNDYIMYRDIADIGDIVVAHYVNSSIKKIEQSEVLDKRISTGSPEVYKYTEYLVKSSESDNEEWLSGYFIKKIKT